LELAQYDRRGLYAQDRLLRAMADGGFDAVVAASPPNLIYTGGFNLDISVFMTFVLTTAAGKQAVVIVEADEPFVRECSWIEDVRPYRFGSGDPNLDALDLLAEAIEESGVARGRIGIETAFMPSKYHAELGRRLRRAELVEAEEAFALARLVKTPMEIELLRLAAYRTDKAIATAFALAQPGDTEKDLQREIMVNLVRLGAEAIGGSFVESGEHSLVWHAPATQRPIERGEVIHVDFGGVFGGYYSDLARNAVVRAPSARQEEIYRSLWEIEQRLFERVKPGVTAHELWELGIKEHTARGLVYPAGTLGHGIGLRVHDGFEVAEGADVPLEPGMVINIEPSHFEPGDARYHIEDTGVVTENGVEIFSDFSRSGELFVIR